MLAADMGAWGAAFADYDAPARSTNGRNPYSDDTDTRFETESDMMELCELAEIL